MPTNCSAVRGRLYGSVAPALCLIHGKKAGCCFNEHWAEKEIDKQAQASLNKMIGFSLPRLPFLPHKCSRKGLK